MKERTIGNNNRGILNPLFDFNELSRIDNE